MRPHRQQLTRLRRPWDSPGKNTEWVATLLGTKHFMEITSLIFTRDFPGGPVVKNLLLEVEDKGSIPGE